MSLINPLKMIPEMMSRDAFLQLSRFGLVGVAATLFHGVALFCWVELVGLNPVVSNALAFSTAFLVSYLGHYHWTFGSSAGHISSMSKFLLTALAGFFANIAIMALVTEKLALNYWIGFAIIVLTIPALTYVISRCWVFADEPG